MFYIFSLITAASFILFVIGLFNPNTSLFWYKGGERTKKLSALIYLACWIGFGAMGQFFAPKTARAEIATTNIETNKPTNIESNWTYSNDVDKMTSKTVYIASCQSENELDFKFPYNGGVKGKISLREKNGETNLYLQISKGQFMPSLMQEKSVKVRFDVDNPQNFSYSSASDGSTETIFISSEQKFIKRLKTAKNLLIEAEYFNEGNRQFEFNVANLNWKN